MNTPKDCITIQDLAFFLRKKGISTGPQLLFRQLRDLHVLNVYNIPLKEYIDAGWFVAVDSLYNNAAVGATPYCRAFVTAKGIQEIQKLLSPDKYNHSTKEVPPIQQSLF